MGLSIGVKGVRGIPLLSVHKGKYKGNMKDWLLRLKLVGGIMSTKWDDLFGTDFYFVITNEERRYMGLDSVEDSWDISQFYRKTNLWHKRTSVFWCNDTIKKVIVEEKRVSDERITYECITEYDTNLQTENREWILPLTTRGKKKKVSVTNILAVNPLGCGFHFHLDTFHEVLVSMSIYNHRNNKSIAMGERDKINKIRNDADFHEFMKYYMETCPSHYFDRIKALRENKHVTVKYKTGDIFRVEVDRFHYSYGIITGQVKEILKWKELPEFHSLRNLMMVPIMVRFYDICTTEDNLSVEDLARIPLGRVEICGDNDIIWGTHKIVGHKELQKEDIEFNLVCTKIQGLNAKSTVHTYDFLVAQGMSKYPDSFNLYVEWGTGTTILSYEHISTKLKEYLKEYRSPHGGLAMGINNIALEGEKSFDYKFNLLNDGNKEIREELFRCLQLETNASFDDFANKYGGMTKEEILRNKL